MSPGFQFSLQRVLDYRIQCEEQAQIALHRARQAHDQQLEQVTDLKAELSRNDAALGESINPTPDEIWLYRSYKERLLQDLATAQARLEELARDVEQRRLELVDCAKERKLLDKLKQTQAQEFEREHQSREQKTFDETATLRHQDRDI